MGRSLRKRERILNDFRDNKFNTLIATDVAARGIDIDTITHVVNYDLPVETEAYVHRIGRTGRMGRSGVAWSLVSNDDFVQLDRISSTWNLTIPEYEAPELPDEPIATLLGGARIGMRFQTHMAWSGFVLA